MFDGTLPIFPDGVIHISTNISFKKEDGRIYYFRYSMPLFFHPENDACSFRMYTAQLYLTGMVKQMDIVRAFGVTPISVKRSVALFKEKGLHGFYEKKEPSRRGKQKLTATVLEKIQIEINNDIPIKDIGEAFEIKISTLRKALSEGRLVKKKSQCQ